MGFLIYFNVLILFLFALVLSVSLTFLRKNKKKSFVYLLFFTIFYVYIGKVLDYTLFQFQSLLVLRFFMPNLMLNGQTSEQSVNLIPLLTLSSMDLKTSLLNILLMIPFGFGLPFITNLRMKKVIVIGLFFSVTIELLQLITGVLAGTTFRVADINDVIFNTSGAAIGYVLFVGFLRVFRYMNHTWQLPKNPILQYLAKLDQR